MSCPKRSVGPGMATTQAAALHRDGLSLETVGISQQRPVFGRSASPARVMCRWVPFLRYRQRGLQRSLQCATRSSTSCWPYREVMQATPQPRGVHGHGRALLNTEAVLRGINCLCSDAGAWPSAMITVSTVGVAGQIPKLAALPRAPGFGNSVHPGGDAWHAPDQALRED